MAGGEEIGAYVRHGDHLYPAAHWAELARFVVGDELDPKGAFRLADDRWDAAAYGERPLPSFSSYYRFSFTKLRSFLKPYVKWYCYGRLLGRGGVLKSGSASLPYKFSRADEFIAGRGYASIDDIAPSWVFAELWEAQIIAPPGGADPLPYKAVALQEGTLVFWKTVRSRFGVPAVVPPVAPHHRPYPVEFAADRGKVIPRPVISQLVNRLALHRDGTCEMNRYDHLRLCVVVLQLCLGRRIGEVLFAPRDDGRDGPLHRYPYKGGGPEGALWFRFVPSKSGPGEDVYVSPEWEDVTRYCVGELLRYGDEVRHLALPEERGLLILVSAWNATWHTAAAKAKEPASRQSLTHMPSGPERRVVNMAARPVSYSAIQTWLAGSAAGRKLTSRARGVLRVWGVTPDGRPGGEVYRLRLNGARHTRQDALAADPEVPVLTRQRDLNHQSRDLQTVYQHQLARQNEDLKRKMREGGLVGRAVEWLEVVCGISLPSGLVGARQGRESKRWAELLRENPPPMQAVRTRCGRCLLPQGPAGCEEHLNCTDAAPGGCAWFLTDPADEEMLIELQEKAREQRALERESAAAGHTVRAGRLGVMAERTESLRDEAFRAAPREVVERLRRRLRELEEGAA